MPRDILLEKTDQDDFFDISFENGDFKSTEGLDTSIIMSIFIDKRASESQIAEPSLRRGWHGNELNDDPTYEIGSTLYLSEQSRLNQETLNRDIASINEGNLHFIEDNIAKNINVTGEVLQNSEQINIQYIRFDDTILNKQFLLWENTKSV
jgi:phage gp46-like protein